MTYIFDNDLSPAFFVSSDTKNKATLKQAIWYCKSPQYDAPVTFLIEHPNPKKFPVSNESYAYMKNTSTYIVMTFDTDVELKLYKTEI